MRIKTITCHDVYNYGATLQAYALIKYLQNLGHDVEIINYKPDYLSTRYNLWGIGPRWKHRSLLIKWMYYALKLPGRLASRRGKHSFDIFRKKYMNITNQRYKCNDELKNNPPYADAYIAGSDQIWNTFYENGRDAAFYLDFAPTGARKISYAASFSISEILPEFKSFVKSMIEKFDFISVREREGLDILQSIGIDSGKHVLDPVFLLDKEMWGSMSTKKFKEKYILVYDFEKNPLIEKFVKKISKQNNLKIYAVNNYSKTSYADKDFYSCGPEIFLSLLKNAELVVSNSFHGTAFSLIFEKQFLVFDRIKQKVNSRMRDLLRICDLKDRLILPDSEFNNTNKNIDYKTVNSRIERYIFNSKSFLDKALK